MSEKWYKKDGVPAAIVSGIFVIIAAIISGIFLLLQSSPPKDNTERNTPAEVRLPEDSSGNNNTETNPNTVVIKDQTERSTPTGVRLPKDSSGNKIEETHPDTLTDITTEPIDMVSVFLQVDNRFENANKIFINKKPAEFLIDSAGIMKEVMVLPNHQYLFEVISGIDTCRSTKFIKSTNETVHLNCSH